MPSGRCGRNTLGSRNPILRRAVCPTTEIKFEGSVLGGSLNSSRGSGRLLWGKGSTSKEIVLLIIAVVMKARSNTDSEWDGIFGLRHISREGYMIHATAQLARITTGSSVRGATGTIK